MKTEPLQTICRARRGLDPLNRRRYERHALALVAVPAGAIILAAIIAAARLLS